LDLIKKESEDVEHIVKSNEEHIKDLNAEETEFV